MARLASDEEERAALLRAMTLANFEGRVDDAIALLDTLSSVLPEESCPWICVSAMIDTLVMAGRYRDALAVPQAWSDEARERGAKHDPRYFALARVNAAEALYNLGRVEDAWSLMQRVATQVADDPVALAGVRVQQGWIATLAGKPEATLELLAMVQVKDLPGPYHAELRYTKAFALFALDRLDEARAEADAGYRCAERVSSFRNGLFLLGAIALRANEPQRALAQFEQGMSHPYRGQGAAALFAYGELLEEVGRSEAARVAYNAVIERDPESPVCLPARARLQALQR